MLTMPSPVWSRRPPWMLPSELAMTRVLSCKCLGSLLLLTYPLQLAFQNRVSERQRSHSLFCNAWITSTLVMFCQSVVVSSCLLPPISIVGRPFLSFPVPSFLPVPSLTPPPAICSTIYPHLPFHLCPSPAVPFISTPSQPFHHHQRQAPCPAPTVRT